MATSIKLSSYYWDPSNIPVMRYISSASDSSVVPTTRYDNFTLQSDWQRIECGGFDNKQAYPNSVDGVQDFGVDAGTDKSQAFTFQNAFTEAPAIICNGCSGEGTDDPSKMKDFSWGISTVDSVSTTGGSIKISVGSGSTRRWLPNIW